MKHFLKVLFAALLCLAPTLGSDATQRVAALVSPQAINVDVGFVQVGNVGNLSVMGAPGGATFTLLNNPGGHFSIVGTEIVADPSTPAGQYSLSVQASGAGFNSVHKTFVLNFAGTACVGVNLSGAENNFPSFATLTEMQYLSGKSLCNARLPIGWGQYNATNLTVVGIQPVPFGPLESTNTTFNTGLSNPNFLYQSHAMATAPWTPFVSGTGSISITNNAGTAPDGSNTASLLALNRSDSSSFAEIFQHFTGANDNYVFGLCLKANSTGDVGKVVSIGLTNDNVTVAIASATLTNAWACYSTTNSLTSATNNYAVIIGFFGSDGASQSAVNVLASNAQVNTGLATLPYVATTGGYLQALDNTIANAATANLPVFIDIHGFGNGPGVNSLFSISSLTSSGTLVTASASPSPGLVNGATVQISGAAPAAYNGTYTISNVTGSSFQYLATGPPGTSPATGTIVGFESASVGQTDLPVTAFADIWGKISAHYKTNTQVTAYDLMNEWFNGFDSSVNLAANQAAINAIRANGDTHPIYIEGVNFSGAWNWVSGQGQSFNNANLYQVVDPLNLLTFSAHSYLDRDSSGTHFVWSQEIAQPGSAPPGVPTSATIGITRLTPFVQWCQQHSLRCNVGETAASSDPLFLGGADNYAAWNGAIRNEISYALTNGVSVNVWGAGPGFSPSNSPISGYEANYEPSSVTAPLTKDFSSAGLQSTELAALLEFTNYTGAQPTAYRIDLPYDNNFNGVAYQTQSVASGNFTIRYNGVVTAPIVITPTDTLMNGTAAGGTFTPASVTVTPGENFIGHFTYTPSQAATIQISATNNGGLTDPPPVGISSQTDGYRALTQAALSNIYGLYNRYTPNIRPAIRLQRSDGQQLDWSLTLVGSTGYLGLDRAAIATWASARSGIKLLTVYDQSPQRNDLTFQVSATLPTLNLQNAAGYPEIASTSGVRGDFNTPIVGQTAMSVIARINQGTPSNDFFRMDQVTGPIYWSGSDFEVFNTCWLGAAVLPGCSPTQLSGTTLNVTTGTYGDYGFVYNANLSTGNRSFKNGSVTATSTTVEASFTGTAAVNNTLVVAASTGTIHLGDGVFGNGVPAGTLFLSQVSGTTGGNGTYQLSNAVTSSADALTASYIFNTTFSHAGVHFNYFQFGTQNWNGGFTNLEFEQGQALSDSQVANIMSIDATYYSTPLPDTLPPLNPAISGVISSIPIYPATYTNIFPFFNAVITDQNSSPTDTVTITLTGTAGTLSGSGISGTGPYTISADTPANVTTVLQNAKFTASTSVAGNTTTFTVLINSSAGTSISNGATSVVTSTYAAETSYATPGGTFTPFSTFGVNLSGGEFSSSPPIGILPPNFEADYFASKGFGLIRLPITSLYLQTTAFGLLNATYTAAIKAVVDHCLANNQYVILDPHDFGNVFNSLNGAYRQAGTFGHDASSGIGSDLFQDEWRRLATLYKNYPNVWFGLMNEPTQPTAVQWRDGGVIPAVTAIRAVGATQLITIPGIAFASARDFVANGSAAAFTGFSADPLNNFIFEGHQYLDSGNSGSSPVATQNGSTVLVAMTNWLVTNGYQALLGEFGIAPDPFRPSPLNILNWDQSQAPITTNSLTDNGNMLSYMKTNRAQWKAWTAWTGGAYQQIPNLNAYGFNQEPLINGSGTGFIVPTVDQQTIPVLQLYDFLLKRDVDPASNDDDPMWLEKAA